MTIFKHEIKQGMISLIIWTLSISFMMAICVLIYPEMGEQMDEISKTFSEMGSFSQAFGMDKLNFGEFTGFFGIECGNVLGLGGAFYAALLGISSIVKEEKEHTAFFLLTHPVSRKRVITEKLFAVLTQLFVMNVIVIIISSLSMLIVNVSVDLKTLFLLYISYFLMQVEIATITFCISTFIRQGGLGIGLGLAAMFYFINIVANLIDETKILKYFTPFGYTDGADIITNKTIQFSYLLPGIMVIIASILISYIKYQKKDIS